MRVLLVVLCCFGSWGVNYAQDGFVEGNPRLAYWQVGRYISTVVVLHGGPGATHQYLRPEFDALAQNAKVIYYDQRGCGQSSRSSTYTWQDHVSDLNRLIHVLAKDQKVVLAGSSWGSVLAILYAYTYPQDVKGLILSGTIVWLGQEKSYQRDSLVAKRAIKVLQGSIGETASINRQTPGLPSQNDTISISRGIEMTSGLVQYEPSMSLVSAPKAERLRQVRLPILLVNGTKSRPFDGANEYIKLFPNIQIQTLADAGHDPWLREPNLFAAICNQFIRTINE